MVEVQIGGQGFSVRESDKAALEEQVRSGSSSRRRREREAAAAKKAAQIKEQERQIKAQEQQRQFLAEVRRGRAEQEQRMVQAEIIKISRERQRRLQLSDAQQVILNRRDPLPVITTFKDIKAIKRKAKFGIDVQIRKEGGRSFKKTALNIIDFVSGGVVTSSQHKKEQKKIDERIKAFNKKYGGKQLTKKQFLMAQREETRIVALGNTLNQKIKKSESKFKRKIIGGVIFGIGDNSFLAKEHRSFISPASISKSRDKIKLFNLRINASTSKISKNHWQKLKKAEIENLKNKLAGNKPRILMGDLPLLPGGGSLKSVKILFVGKQVRKGNKIITNVVFRQGNKIVGMARGVTVIKGNISDSIVVGKSGVKVLNVLTSKFDLKKVSSFIGKERAVTKESKFALNKTIQLLKNRKKLGLINVIKKNIQGFSQLGVGQTSTVKGHKFFRTTFRFPSARFAKVKAKGISVDDFVSMSSIFTRKDLSLIIGNTITGQGAKAKFIGLIQGRGKLSKGFKVGGATKTQYNQALKKVVSVASSSLAKAQKPGLTKQQTISQAVIIARKSIGVRRPSKVVRAASVVKKKPKVVAKVRTKIQQRTKVKPLSKTRSTQLTNLSSRVNTRIKSLTKQLGKTRNRTKQNLLQRQITKLKQKQKLLQKQLQQQKLKKLVKIKAPRVTVPRVPRKPFPIPLVIPKGFKKKTLVKKQPVFLVKEKIKGRIVTLTPRPLAMIQAKDFLAYRLDHRLSRTGYFEPLGAAKIVVGLPAKMNGYFRKNSRKLRPYKIRVGVKKALRRGFIEKNKYTFDKPGEKRRKRRK